jgi:hypothetical protein
VVPRTLLPVNPSHLRRGEMMSFQFEGHIDGERPTIEPIYVPYHTCRDIANELFDTPHGATYASPEEIHDVLEHALLTRNVHDAAEVNVNAVVDALIETLAAKPQQWEIRSAFLPSPDFDIDVAFDFGDGQPLRLAMDVEAQPKTLCLTGTILAHTIGGALVVAEKAALTILGAGIASGVFAYSPPRRPVPVASVMINGEVSYFEPTTQGIIAGCWADYPRDLSEIERASLLEGRSEHAVTRHLRTFAKALRASGARADEIRNACRTACLAATASDEGVALTLCFALIEGLLLDTALGENVLARLREAVAHSVGGTHDERKRLRDAMKRLYDLRSGFVHSVRLQRASQARQHAVELMLRVLKREIELLPTS